VKTWSTACLDWQDRILASPHRSLIPFEPLFPAEAESALEIFRSLRIVDAAGRPTFGEAGRDWILDFVGAVFGAYDAEEGRRHIQNFFLLISKKNGKSTLAAGIMITALIRNWRQSGEFYILAPTKEVADNSYAPARDMVMADTELRAILKPSAGRVIEHRNTGAFLKVIAADTEVVSGKKTIGLLVDELHVFGKRANAENMLLEATGGLASRPEGFVIYLSTQSEDQPAGVFAQKLKEFRAIRDGQIVVPGSLPVLYEYPSHLLEEKAYQRKDYWFVTNPNMGASVDEQYLSVKHDEAARAGKPQLNGFFAKHLNVEIGQGLSNDGWRGADYWEACADKTLTLPALIARSEVCTIGFDVGGLDDLFGLAVMGREKVTRRWLLWTKAFCVQDVLETRKEIAPRLRDFAEERSLIIRQKPGDIIPLIIADIAMVKDAGLLPEKKAVGFDPNSVAAMIEALAGIGITGEMLVRLIQGPALSPAIWGLEHKLSDGTVSHCGSEMMNWVVGNAKVEIKANGNMITKQVAGRAKIDPLHAAFCATIPMSWNPEAKPVFDMDGWLKHPAVAI
jgi:phage terminase large subunit-like protein